MAFRRAAIALSLVVGFLFAATAHAGWWHHRHCCTYANGQSAYYLAPAAPGPAVQASPQSMLIEALLPVVLDIARRRIGGTTSQPPIIATQPGGTGSWESDLASLRNELAATTASVENANAVLRRHGEELANLRLELGDVRTKIDQVGQTVSSAGAIQAALAQIKANQPLKSKQELIQDLTNDALYARVKAQLNLPDEAAKKALLDNLKGEITDVIHSAFGGAR